MRRRLTELAIPRLAEGIHWDTLLPSFGIRIGARRKTWIIAQRRVGSPHPVRLKLGTWPAMPLADARTKARLLLAGADAPTANRAFLELAEQFLDDGRSRSGRPWRPATAKAYRIMLAKAAPLHQRPVQDIRRRDVALLLRTIAATSGAPSAALAKAALSRFLAWAIEHDLVEGNIVTGTSSYVGAVGDRVLSDVELRQLWHAAEDGFGLILKLLLWTGARRSEVGGMRRSELQDGVWTIPGTRTEKGRRLMLPLAQQTVACLEQLPQIFGHENLFGIRPAGFLDWTRAKQRLDARLRFNQPWRIHDLRRTTQTRLAGLGVSRDVVGRILNHGISAIDRAYDHHDYRDEKQRALQSWANALDEIVLPCPTTS
jgi:integrase